MPCAVRCPWQRVGRLGAPRVSAARPTQSCEALCAPACATGRSRVRATTHNPAPPLPPRRFCRLAASLTPGASLSPVEAQARSHAARCQHICPAGPAVAAPPSAVKSRSGPRGSARRGEVAAVLCCGSAGAAPPAARRSPLLGPPASAAAAAAPAGARGQLRSKSQTQV